MSVIVALISGRDGVVASDGRYFKPAHFHNGVVKQPASIESNDFDKTFSLDGGKLIGAFSGLMLFSNKSVSEHVSDIASPLLSRPVDLPALTTEIEKQMTKELTSIDEKEVIFRCRQLDLLLVGDEKLSRSEMRIVSIRFYPEGHVITSKRDTNTADRKLRYVVRGDDKAAAAAARGVLDCNNAPNRDLAFLRKLATRAVQFGIRATGTHEHGSDQACGGTIFVQRTFYK